MSNKEELPIVIEENKSDNRKSLSDYFKTFFQKVNSIGGICILIATLLGLGYKAGTYYEFVKNERKMSELINKHQIELIEQKEMYLAEIYELRNQINIVNIRYEKEVGKK